MGWRRSPRVLVTDIGFLRRVVHVRLQVRIVRARLVFVPPKGRPAAGRPAARVLRAIHERAVLQAPGYLASLKQGVAAGEQARVLPWLPMKLFLVDDRLGILPLQAAPTAIESSVVVHQSALLEALTALFETLWHLSLPPELAATNLSLLDNPSAEERLILASLTAGLPDEAIARQLGLSDRTYQRRIHDLMERLHAQTRFQLARQAARRGWLDADKAAPRKSPAASHQ